jgi:hypothetical protein
MRAKTLSETDFRFSYSATTDNLDFMVSRITLSYLRPVELQSRPREGRFVEENALGGTTQTVHNNMREKRDDANLQFMGVPRCMAGPMFSTSRLVTKTAEWTFKLTMNSCVENGSGTC